MKTMHTQDKRLRELDNNPERKHCLDCCHYLDDVKIAQQRVGKEDFAQGRVSRHEWIVDGLFPGLKMCDTPGYQWRQYTVGDSYQQAGYYTPCHCPAGVIAAKAMAKIDDEGQMVGQNVQIGKPK
jgi:hypothetical protein